jgi:Na+/proline symporter
MPVDPAAIVIMIIISISGILNCVALFFRRKTRESQIADEFYLANRKLGAIETGIGFAALYFGSAGMTTLVASIYKTNQISWSVLLEIVVSVVAVYLIGSKIRIQTDDSNDATTITWLARAYRSETLVPLVFAACILSIIPSVALVHVKIAESIWKESSFSNINGLYFILITIITTMISITGLKGTVRFQASVFATTILFLLISAMFACKIAPDIFTAGSNKAVASSRFIRPSILAGSLDTSVFSSILIACVPILRFSSIIRCQASRNSRTVKRGAVLFAAISIVGVILPLYILARFAAASFPPRIDEQWNVLPNPILGSTSDDFSRIIPVIARFISVKVFGRFHTIFLKLLIISFMAIAIGSFITYIHLFGSIFSKDIYSRFLRGNCGLSEAVLVGRVSMILLGLILPLIIIIENNYASNFRPSVLLTEIAMASGAIAVQFIPSLIDRLYLKRWSKYGVVVGFLVGVIIVVLTSDLATAIFAKVWPSLLNRQEFQYLHSNYYLSALFINICVSIIVGGVHRSLRRDDHG